MLIVGGDMKDPHEAILDLITDSMTIYLDMFRAFVKHRIVSNVNSGLVIAEQLRRGSDRDL